MKNKTEHQHTSIAFMIVSLLIGAITVAMFFLKDLIPILAIVNGVLILLDCGLLMKLIQQYLNQKDYFIK